MRQEHTDRIPGSADAEPGKAVGKEIKHLRKSGRVREAIELGEKDLRENGDTARVLCSLGSAYLQIGNYDQAEERFNRTLAVNPRDEVAMNALGQVSLARGNYDQAEERFNRTLAVNPRNEVAMLLGARLALQRGNFPNALQIVSEQLNVRPHVPTMRIAKLMAENGIGGKQWQERYDFMVTFGTKEGLFSPEQSRSLTRCGTVLHQPERLSPEFFRQLDEVIGEVSRSKIFTTNIIPRPINADAAHVAGIPATPRDAYRRNGGGGHNGTEGRQ